MNKYICLSFDFILIIFLLNDVFHILFSLQRPKIDRCNEKNSPFFTRFASERSERVIKRVI